MKGEYGIQLYSIRDMANDDYPRMLREVAKLGYRTVETAGFFGYTANEMSQMISDAGLRLVGTHSPLYDLTKEKLPMTLEYHKALGNKNYIVPAFDISSEEKLWEAIEIFNYAYPILKNEGICLAFHNHSQEFEISYGGKTVMEWLIEKTNIDFEIDTYWSWNAGIDTEEFLRKNRDRIHLIHLKDGVKGGEGFALGEGDVPLEKFIALARQLGMHIVVESETLSPSGIEEITRCISYLKSLD